MACLPNSWARDLMVAAGTPVTFSAYSGVTSARLSMRTWKAVRTGLPLTLKLPFSVGVTPSAKGLASLVVASQTRGSSLSSRRMRPSSPTSWGALVC